jgi:hypothetical protein
VSRTAGLLAIAVFGVMMLHGFSQSLGSRLSEIQMDEQLRHSIYEQRVKLAALEVPPNTDSATLEKIKVAIAESFVSGFRKIMFASAALAVASGASSWFFIRKSRLAGSKQQRD